MSALAIIGVLAVAFLAFSNGANDNFKGVATLFGSKTTSHKTALLWATVTTLAGSLVAVVLAQELMANFSGKGLVPDSVTQAPAFLVAVALAAAVTVFAATRLGFPISTTHAMTGALIGAGWMASETGINLGKLGSAFFLPMLISPLLALTLALILYPALSFTRKHLGVSAETCFCVGREVISPAPAAVPSGGTMNALVQFESLPRITVGTKVSCQRRYQGEVFGFDAKMIVDSLHFISAGAMSFARGLNDTPKIVAALMVITALQPQASLAFAGVLIALGGWFYSGRIAQTMSFQITSMNDGQGLTANMVTSAIVLGASKLGLPVSTTHVSCGALFGIGAISGQANWKVITRIVSAWITTLPVAAFSGAAVYVTLHNLF